MPHQFEVMAALIVAKVVRGDLVCLPVLSTAIAGSRRITRRCASPRADTTSSASTCISTRASSSPRSCTSSRSCTSTSSSGRPRTGTIRCDGRRLRGGYDVRVGPAIRLEVVARHVGRVHRKLLDGRVDLAGILRMQAVDQRIRRRARGAVTAQLIPEPSRVQASLGLIEGVGIGLIGLDLLDQSGNVALEAVILDGGRHLPQMVTVLDELGQERRLCCIVVERRRRGVQRRKRRRVEQRLHARIALGDVDDVAMNVVDRAPDILAEVGSQDRRAGRRIDILDRCDLFVKLIDDDMHVQIGEIVDLRICRTQLLLYANKIRDDQVDLIRANTADLAGRCIVE
jgi:hypothetical protein